VLVLFLFFLGSMMLTHSAALCFCTSENEALLSVYTPENEVLLYSLSIENEAQRANTTT
jgi:hypothetical protein